MSKYECNICGYQTGELVHQGINEDKELVMHLEIEHPTKKLPKGQTTLYNLGRK